MRRVIIALALVLAGPQLRPAEARPWQRVAQNGARKEKIKKRLRAMRAAALISRLDLDEATAAKLMPVIDKYDDDFAKLAKENADLRQKAEDASAQNDDKALDKVIDDMVANQRARWDLDEKRFAEVRKVLTAKQSAQILVILPEVDQRILNVAKRAAKRRDGGQGQDDDGN